MEDSSGARVQLRCLGPFELRIDGQPIELPGTRPRTLLTALALRAGRTVTADQLATVLWGDDDQPADPRASIYTLVSRLRTRLGADLVHRHPDGYRLGLADVDAIRFDRLLQAGRLEDAIQLWRGTPFIGLASSWLDRYETPQLTERYLDAVERLAAIPDTGQLPRLLELATAHPLRESLWQRLIVALDACGRTAEALDRYDEIRRRIADELGVDLSPGLQAVYQSLLSHGSQLIPRQLPSPGTQPVGRETELKALNEVADRDTHRIAVIMGTAGVGKTTLAVHWAQQYADRFPDGQLYVNLRGFEPTANPVSAEDAVHGFLTALNVPVNTIPAGLDAKAALFRSFVADRELLILLDNARTADQVRPLLPGTTSCLVVITTRLQLDGVIAAGAEPIVLDLLSRDAARQLLIARLGPDRVGTAPTAVEEIIRYCAGLPLALALVATRAAIHRDFGLDTIATELRDSRLNVLSGPDTRVDVRAVFSWSYVDLRPEAAYLFRLIGRHPGPGLSAEAVAAVLDRPASEATVVLRELQRAHLIDEPRPGWFTMHDLLRAYAQDLPIEDADRTAEQRMRDFYLRAATTAAARLDAADFEWFTAERSALLAFLTATPSKFLPVLQDYLDRSGHWQDWIDAGELTLADARQRQDLAAERHALLGLALAHNRLENFAVAADLAAQCLAVARRMNDVPAEARALRVLSFGISNLGRHDESLALARESLELYTALDDEREIATCLNAIGWELAHLDRLDEAQLSCRESVVRLEALGDRASVAATYDSLGHIAARLGQPVDALSNYRAAAELYERLADRYHEALARMRLADALATADQDPRPEYDVALALFTQLHHPQVAAVRAKLSAVDETSA
ncbi:BTAD domain-containing putative transcriptional regulator [Kribbella sp. NPDC051952]|uniref:AfsR/SARP family transcriptional regulator n=1 Tax=Kribbella sp. NPDC051952 TaxID=3154851 RepID=UPI00343D4B80